MAGGSRACRRCSTVCSHAFSSRSKAHGSTLRQGTSASSSRPRRPREGGAARAAEQGAVAQRAPPTSRRRHSRGRVCRRLAVAHPMVTAPLSAAARHLETRRGARVVRRGRRPGTHSRAEAARIAISGGVQQSISTHGTCWGAGGKDHLGVCARLRLIGLAGARATSGERKERVGGGELASWMWGAGGADPWDREVIVRN